MHPPESLVLSRLRLNLQSAPARRDIFDPYQLHRTLLRAFDTDRATAGLLSRLDLGATEATVLVQSRQSPDWSQLPDDYLAGGLATPNPAVRDWQPRFAAGQILRFRLRANPTFKRGRRRLAWLHESEQQSWLQRQGDRGGFGVLQAWGVGEGFVTMNGRGFRKPPLTCYSVLLDGFLAVTDPALLVQTVAAGLGSGKAFGFGLLSLAPAEVPLSTPGCA